MWARVKGATENALLRLPLQVYLFRPGYIQPMHGTVSRTRLYRLIYVVATPLYPIVKRLFPGQVNNTEQLGRAMAAQAARSERLSRGQVAHGAGRSSRATARVAADDRSGIPAASWLIGGADRTPRRGCPGDPVQLQDIAAQVRIGEEGEAAPF